jgi:hypothetical protein
MADRRGGGGWQKHGAAAEDVEQRHCSDDRTAKGLVDAESLSHRGAAEGLVDAESLSHRGAADGLVKQKHGAVAEDVEQRHCSDDRTAEGLVDAESLSHRGAEDGLVKQPKHLSEQVLS